jgi:MFS family permease
MLTNYQIYFAVRFLQGVTCGLFSAVIPMIVKEASPHDMGSITGSFTNLSIIFGLFFVYMFGYLLKLASGDPSGGATWQVLFLFPVLTVALQSIILVKVFPYETPKYLAHNNKTQ